MRKKKEVITELKEENSSLPISEMFGQESDEVCFGDLVPSTPSYNLINPPDIDDRVLYILSGL